MACFLYKRIKLIQHDGKGFYNGEREREKREVEGKREKRETYFIFLLLSESIFCCLVFISSDAASMAASILSSFCLFCCFFI